MKYGIIPDTNIRFKLGDIVEVPSYEGPQTYFGTITAIEDTLLDIRGYYNIYINGETCYYRSSDVFSWYRKNRKGVLVKYFDDKRTKE